MNAELIDNVPVEEALLRLDEEVDVALSTPDLPALLRLMAEDYVHAHSHGLRQSRAEFLDRLAQRDDVPVREQGNVVAESHGDIAITAGDVDVRYGGKRPDVYKRYVRVWRRTDAGWALISHRNLAAKDREPT